MVKRQRDQKHIDMIHCHKDHETERTEQITLDVKAHQQSVCVCGGGGFFWIALMLGMGRAGGYNFLKQGGRGSIFCSFTKEV